MKIGIISDSHDRINRLTKAISMLNDLNVEILLHCGDLATRAALEEMQKFKGHVHFVFGNIDDRAGLKLASDELKINLHDELGEIIIDKKKIAFLHYPELARSIAESGEYDAVFYGHTHIPKKQMINKTLLINPGEIQGRKGFTSFATYDTITDVLKIIKISTV